MHIRAESIKVRQAESNRMHQTGRIPNKDAALSFF
jgi:hypothetical protein